MRISAGNSHESKENHMDYYSILGVKSQATQKEIKAAYRTLAKRYHPDVVKDHPEQEKKMYDIQEAYAVLGDEEKRKQYDESLKKNQKGFGRQKKGFSQSEQREQTQAPDMGQFERFFGFQPGKGMETYQDRSNRGKKPEGPIKPEEMFQAFFGTGKH